MLGRQCTNQHGWVLAAAHLPANPPSSTKPFNTTLLKVMTARLLPCRLGMLERLCTTWHGWVSAAVYLPASPSSYTTHLHAAVAQLDQLHADFEQGSACCLLLISFVVRPGMEHMPLTTCLAIRAFAGRLLVPCDGEQVQEWHIVPGCNHDLVCTTSARPEHRRCLVCTYIDLGFRTPLLGVQRTPRLQLGESLLHMCQLEATSLCCRQMPPGHDAVHPSGAPTPHPSSHAPFECLTQQSHSCSAN